MDNIPKILPEITFIAEDEKGYELLCNRVQKMPLDAVVLEATARKKFKEITIGLREYRENWYLEEVLNDFMPLMPFWNDGDFIEFFKQYKIRLRMCIVIHQFGTYPGMTVDNKVLNLLNKFNGDLDFDIYSM